VRRIAEILDRDPDELLALAGRVASDLTDITLAHEGGGHWQLHRGLFWPITVKRAKPRKGSSGRPISMLHAC
jgi:hypothetical protein